MNRKKIILTATAVVLAAAGVFAGVKKAVPTSIYVRSSGGSACHLVTSNNAVANFTNVKPTGAVQAAFQSKGGTQLLIFSTSGCASNPLYYRN